MLDLIKKKLGYGWKEKIRHAWMTGKYPSNLTEDDKVFLQRYRNKHGYI